MTRWLAALALILSTTAGAAAPPERLRLQLNWLPEPEFGGIYAAREGGHFAAAGLEVEILKGGPDVPAVQMAASGRVELAVAAADEVVALRARGARIVALFATYQTSPQAIMVRAGEGVTSIPELLARGGTLIAQPGLAYLKWLRRQYGLEKMRIVPYGAGAMAQFLDSRQREVAMQCFVFAEPLAARRQGVEPRVLPIADTGFDPYAAVIVTREQFLAGKQDTLRRFVAALRAGWQAYLEDPEPTNRVMAALNTAMDLPTFAAAAQVQRPFLESDTTRARGLGAMSEERWRTLVRQLRQLGVIDREVDPRACFVNL
ncbi:MAG: ABC transporter substrate-binding protein [Acidobacteriota bacterium]|jgi:NitT/TauT family transport system substrate-binding protein